jgi:hypothetical protein
VRSCTLDAWTADGVAVMGALGNGPANAQLEARLPAGGRPGSDAPAAALSAFVRAKYVAMQWSAGGDYPPAAALAALHRPGGGQPPPQSPHPLRPRASAPAAPAPGAAISAAARQPALPPQPVPQPQPAPLPRLVPPPPAVADLIQFSDSSSSSSGDVEAATTSAPPTLASAQAGGLLAAAVSDPRLNILAWLQRAEPAGPLPPAMSTAGCSGSVTMGAAAGGTGASSSSSAPHAPYRAVPWFFPPGSGGPRTTRAGSGARLPAGPRPPANGGPPQLPPDVSFPTGASARSGYTGLSSASSAGRGQPAAAGLPVKRAPQSPLQLAGPQQPPLQARLDPRAAPAPRTTAAVGPALIWPAPPGGQIPTYEYRPERDDDIASHR